MTMAPSTVGNAACDTDRLVDQLDQHGCGERLAETIDADAGVQTAADDVGPLVLERNITGTSARPGAA